MKALQFVGSIAIDSVSLLPFPGPQATAAEPTIQVTSPTADSQIGQFIVVLASKRIIGNVIELL
jgi:hypothetical protein